MKSLKVSLIALFLVFCIGIFAAAQDNSKSKAPEFKPITLSEADKDQLRNAKKDVEDAETSFKQAEQAVQATSAYQAYIAANEHRKAVQNAYVAIRSQIVGDLGKRPSDCSSTQDLLGIQCKDAVKEAKAPAKSQN